MKINPGSLATLLIALLVSAPEASGGTQSALIELGGKLFSDKRLSLNQTVSCASCHNLERNGADHSRFSNGAFGLTSRNSPSVWNTAGHQSFFWDGRASGLTELTQKVLLNPLEVGWKSEADFDAYAPHALGSLSGDFNAAFGDSRITLRRVSRAVAQFVRTLSAQDSPYTKYTNGDQGALSPVQKLGMQKFLEKGCGHCHQGSGFGGLHRFRSPAHPSGLKKAQELDLLSDPGLMSSTGKESDRNMWKVPSLLNVGVTSPYFHNGSVESLEDAVSTEALIQSGQQLSDQEIQAIAEFLRSLTDDRFRDPPKR